VGIVGAADGKNRRAFFFPDCAPLIPDVDFSAKCAELCCSANGAKYDSQGQALSGAKRVAPGYQISIEASTESAK
jgi:hypothetical protein